MEKSCNFPHIYIVHYKKLVERKRSVLLKLEKAGITDFTFIENFDRDDFLVKTEEHRQVFAEQYPPVHCAITSSHLMCFKLIADSGRHGMIFEDDVILDDNFKAKFLLYKDMLPEDFDMLFIGNGCDLHVSEQIQKSKPPPNIYPTKRSRCADSYYVNHQTAKKILEYIQMPDTPKINDHIDHWLNRLAEKMNLTYYWSEPTIVQQASQNGDLPNSYLPGNPHKYWKNGVCSFIKRN